jgi:hypothetical protein
MRTIPAVLFVAVFAALAAASSTAAADRLTATIALGEKSTAAVEAPGAVVTYGFLVTSGQARKLVLSVTRTKKPASSLVPDVKLYAPDGTAYAFGGTGDSVSAPGASAWSAKILDVPQTGLWRLEIRGGNGTSGAFTLAIKGKDTMSAAVTPAVPTNGFTDTTVFAGENTAITIATQRTAVSKTIVPRLQILDGNGNALEGGHTFVANDKGVLKLTSYHLPVFGRYTLRFTGVGGIGGQFALKVKTAPAKLKTGLPVADARAVVVVEPGITEAATSGEVEPGFAGGLDATHSSAAAGQSLAYRWTQVSGPSVVLSGADTATPTYVAGPAQGSIAFQLSVSAAGVLSKAATVGVEVAVRPIADAGRAIHADAGAAVVLDGGASTDRRGTGIRYVWSQDTADATAVTLRDAATAHPSFDAPAAGGVLRFALVVDDGAARSYRYTVIVDAGATGRRVAEAGRDQWVPPMATVYLCGLQSSAAPGAVLDGQIVWTQVAGPSVVLAGADTPWPSFQAPKAAADLAFKLTLDGADDVADRVAVHVRAAETDTPPTTRANGPFSAVSGSVAMSAGASSDPAHDPLLARWAQVAGPRLPLATPDALAATATLPAGSEAYTFAVQVNDALQYGAPDLVGVRNDGYSGLPLALAGPDVAVAVAGGVVALDGRNSTRTAGTGPLTYQWTQLNGLDWYDVAAKIPAFDRTAARPVFALPPTLASLSPTRTMLFELVVNDGTSWSRPDLVTVRFDNLAVNSMPTVTASASTTSALVGQGVSLFGTKDDLDTDPSAVTVEWTQIANGAPSVSLQPSAMVTSPTFVMPDTTLPILLKLVAYDGMALSAPANVTVNVDRKPTAAIAVSPQTAAPGATITFSGTGSSDPENHALTYRWTQILPPSPALVADLTTPSISFAAPATAAKFQLIVNDSRQDSAPVSASFAGYTVTASASPLDTSINGTAPFPGDLAGYAAYGSTVTLSANPVGGAALPTFTWRVISQAPSVMPTVTLSSTSAQNPTFTVPSPGNSSFGWSPMPQATFGVIAHAGGFDSVEGTVTIYFFASLNNGTSSMAGTPSNNTVYGIVTPNCTGCHSGSSNTCPVGSGNNASGMGLATKSAFLSNTRGMTACASSNTRLPTAGTIGASATSAYLLDRLTGAATPQMPQGFSSFLPSSKVNLIRDWIDQGCLDN